MKNVENHLKIIEKQTEARRVKGRWSRPAALAAMRSSQAMTTLSKPWRRRPLVAVEWGRFDKTLVAVVC